MNALKQRLDTKPAFPQGFPAGRTIAMAGQIAPICATAFQKAPVGISVGV